MDKMSLSAPSRSIWLFAATLFLVFALAVTVSRWNFIQATSYEVGDFASNSVLIQSAKTFSLFHGNYSRVGFYHPGPAILYVLMAGEVIFHDWLKWTTPVGGQLIGVIAYSAMWLALSLVLLARLLASRPAAAVFICVFAAFSLQFEYSMLTNLWMPNIYYMPFGVFLISVALIVRGDMAYLPISALSAGFLVNGHVSFVAIVGVMLVGALSLNALLRGASSSLTVNTGRYSQFLIDSRRPILLSFGVFLAFLLPLAVHTVLAYPGSVPRYISFGSGNSGNGVVASARFLASYFQGAVPIWVFPVAILFLAVQAVLKPEFRAAIIAVLGALMCAAVATFIYAKTGIDDLSHRYVAFYFYTVPSALLSLSVVVMLASLRRLQIVAGALIACVAIVHAATQLRLPNPGPEQYDARHIPALRDKLRTLGTRLVLDLDNTRNWTHVWLTLTGLEAYSSRRGEQYFCVRKNWHIALAEHYRCSDSLQDAGRTLFVAAAGPKIGDADPIIDFAGLHIYVTEPPSIHIGEVLRIAQMGEVANLGLLASGWSEASGDFAWSVAPEAVLAFQTDTSATSIRLDLSAFTPGTHVLTADILVDSGPATRVTFDANSARHSVTLALPPQNRPGATRRIIFRMINPISPQQIGMSADARPLGVALYGLTLQ